MKIFTFILSLSFLSLTTHAQLADSSLEARHQELIKNAAVAKCGLSRGNVEIVQNKTSTIKVDQGITDYTYETVVAVNQRVDQLIYDTYHVTISSSYYDHYDHNTKNWGVYQIDGASDCVQQ